jgi:glycine oxidase
MGMTDVVIVGGGVVGLSIAYELAGQGVAVRVLEQGHVGREASWAGAGILPPGNLAGATTPEARLRAHSHSLWPEWTESLCESTGIDNGYRNCGGLEIQHQEHASQLDSEIQCWRDEGVAVEWLTMSQLTEISPAVASHEVVAAHLPELCQVRNPRHLKALQAACATRDVDIIEGEPVVDFEGDGERITSVRTSMSTYTAGRFCIASGAWSRPLLMQAGCESPLEPVRGQIVLLNAQPLPFGQIIQSGPRYLVPRPDGRILIGSTEEHVGFDKRNTAAAVAELIDFAVSLVPALAEATYERSWAGLRPCTPDGLPYLGQVPETRNLFVAAGHFRAGLQMSPATAVLMREVLLEQPTTISLDGLACDRLRSSTADIGS